MNSPLEIREVRLRGLHRGHLIVVASSCGTEYRIRVANDIIRDGREGAARHRPP